MRTDVHNPKTFYAQWLRLLANFDMSLLEEVSLAALLGEFSPAEDESFDEFAFRMEWKTGEKFLSARSRGIILRKLVSVDRA